MRIQPPEFRSPSRGASATRSIGVLAFSLLEVLIAMTLFFVAIFSILNLTSQNIAAARHLQNAVVDAGSLATALSLTNRLEEGGLPQEIAAEFEKLHPGYTCNGSIFEVSSNGLFQVDLEIYGLKGKKVVASGMSILLYRPESSSAAGASLRNRTLR
jgi:Tfp pilus assembly protein PilV